MPAPRQHGFTYLSLIILLSIISLVGAAGVKTGSLLQRAAAEEELLEIGAQFSEALRSYAAATPPGKPPQPPTLQDLLRDPRFPNVRRHLRKVFVDPITGKAEWGIIYLGDKVGVLGVYSLSDRKPLKIANFDIRFSNLENKEKISDWKFLIAGGEGAVGSIITPPNSMTGSAAPGSESLFPPRSGEPGGGKDGSSVGTGAGGKGGTPGSSAPGGPAGPIRMVPVPVPAEEEEEAPETTPGRTDETEEDKDEVKAEEKDGRTRDEEVEPVDPAVSPATQVLPPPVSRRR